jgi:23S rRNA C2498 (ribose-2'-O)-methylase RlmM
VSHTISETRFLDTLTCSNCNVLFALDSEFIATAKRDRKTFYCPNGHSQWFPGKTEKELRKEADRRAANAEEEARILAVQRDEARKELRRLKQRAEAGACPYCNRSFVQLTRHIHTKHPGEVHP